ncbi:bifunctional glycosyltransferase family 2/GtrA family protein [Lysinibacillus odysseyi]|uniref:Family 2 glycosyl transferase n=1 Tax=Lysinibacillus odysseyi 34hs-1 = NBRC 100172 TaxID=1220589 RepID=A0A0A3IDW7_9BACI|nr:bifunctional glycosyltransferase family 2/GtrA family protein [Lysinibacillus odysseyi]KGR81655.1 family 2 glycosyl transferase [Lysinibacillus odysseyi 34hs-1 = NBRC 100172]
MKEIGILMPAYQPDEKAIRVIEELIQVHTGPIFVVDDGSDTSYIFNKLNTFRQVTILRHAVNQGKGRALKTGFHHICNEHPELRAVVTIDADGQHLTKDILNIVQSLDESDDALVLGSRNFSGKDIPLRSKFGNQCTKIIYRFVTGTRLNDTQTGLRGIPTKYLPQLLSIEGERFEYEMNVLAKLKELNIPIAEVPIDTMYLEGNKSSHFRPFHDSFQVYKVFLLYALTSSASFLIDLALFMLFAKVFKIVAPMSFLIIATILARLLSSFFNYYINRHTVFKSGSRKSLYRYYLLAAFIMVTSAGSVQLLYSEWLQNGEIVLKVLVDTALFILAFVVQRKWVFKKEKQIL